MGRAAGVTVERVVEVASGLADAAGPEAVTLASVARELGIRTPSLYNHVDGLEDLRRRLTVRAVTILGERLARSAIGRAGPDAVRALATAFRDLARERPGLYAFTVPTTEVDDDEVRRAGQAATSTVIDVLLAYGLDEVRAVHAARTFRAAVHGFVDLERSGGFGLGVEVDESFAWMLDVFLAGLAREAADA